MKLITARTEQLNELCQKHNVCTMHVFGSVATNSFSLDSDIDFLVKFLAVNPVEYFDNYMNLKENLECLFDRKVDLVEIQTLKNPILKRSIDRNTVLVYERKNTEMAI